MAGLIETPVWEPEVHQLERTDAVVGGVPNAITKAGTSNVPHMQMNNRIVFLKAQFDALQNGAGYRAVLTITAGLTLTAADMGECIIFTGTSAATVVLPAISAVPAGSAIEFINTGTAALTIQRAGSDEIDSGPSNVTSIVIPPNQSLKLIRATGSSLWHPVSVTAAGLATSFGSSLGANGWQRLPSGLIIQWGSAGASLSDTTQLITLPITFPSAIYGAWATVQNNAAVGFDAVISAHAFRVSTSQIRIGQSGTAASGTDVTWLAIGS
jgi:hypothetical protein